MVDPVFYEHDEAYDVQVGDAVLLNLHEHPEAAKFAGIDDLFGYEGNVTAVHAAKGEVTVRYDTGDTFRSSGNPKFATKRLPLERVQFSARCE